jgi:3-oxoacyl-[acyl-carrier protein] reductase
VHAYGLDVRNSADCDALVKQAMTDLGGLDIVVKGARVTRDNLLMRLSDADYDADIAAERASWSVEWGGSTSIPAS